jgi:hypothetical protein
MSWIFLIFFGSLPAFRNFSVHRIHPFDFYVKQKFFCFRGKFRDQSTLRIVGFRLEEKITN